MAASITGPPLVPGRACGPCNVCCVALTIEDPRLRKVQGVRCANALPDNRCGIYRSRPGACRRFECGWRQLKWVRDSLRPDLSGVLIRVDRLLVGGAPVQSVVFTLLSDAALIADGIAEALATAVMSGRPVFLEVVGAPGFTYGMARVDGALAAAVQFRDRGAVLALVSRAWTEGRAASGRAVPIVP